jgi:hypothetical protein
VNAIPVPEGINVYEAGDLPLLMGGGLYEGEELWPEQEKQLLVQIKAEERLREGMAVPNYHECPSWLSRRT